jgi:hypothetical protein
LKTRIVVEIEHHEAVNVAGKAIPVIDALISQMYSVSDYHITKT